MRLPRFASFPSHALLACFLLVACGGDKAAADAALGEDGLPKPAAAGGSVTGMPNPGVAEVRPATSSAPEPDIVELPEPVEGDSALPLDPGLPADLDLPPPALAEPSVVEDPDTPASSPADEAASSVREDGQQ